MVNIFTYKKILIGVIIVIALAGALGLFIYDSYRMPDNVVMISGSITGLPPFTGEKNTRITFLSVIDPETALIESIQERRGEVMTYQLESSPGLKIVIVHSFDLITEAYYFGASPIVLVSPGKSNVADIDLKLQALIPLTLAAETAPAGGEKPIIGITRKGKFTSDSLSHELMKKGFNVIDISEEVSKIFDSEYELGRQALGKPYNPVRQDPNFIAHMDVEIEKHLIHPGRPETYDIMNIKISLIEVKTGKVIAEKSSTETNKIPFDVIKDVAEEFVGRIGGTGFDAIEIPPFTPSEPKPITGSASAWAERFRKIADEAVGGVGGKEKDATSDNTLPKKPTPPPPKSSCNIPAFQACANTFSLQGCINACPYVSTTCPPGTPSDTDCKKTDQSCSNTCWNTADRHIESCLATSNCTKKEVISGGGGAKR